MFVYRPVVIFEVKWDAYMDPRSCDAIVEPSGNARLVRYL